MAQRTPKPPAVSAKARYRVTNWHDYNRALVARGAITLWIDEEVFAGWRAIRPPPRLEPPPPTRGQAVARIAEVGRNAWKQEAGYQPPLPRRDRHVALQDHHRTQPEGPHLRQPAGRGRHRHALPQPLHRPRHARERQDR